MSKKNDKCRFELIEEDLDIVLWGIFFEKLLENLDTYVLVCDKAGMVIFANTRCTRFFDSPGGGILGENWIRRIIPRAKRKEVESVFLQIKKQDRLSRFDVPVISTMTLEKYCHCVMVPLRENKERLYMLLLKEYTDPARRSAAVGFSQTPERSLSGSYSRIIRALFDASMVADAETAVHATRVMSYAVILARKLGVSRTSIRRLKTASLLHDLGKIAVDAKILNKPGKLTAKEYEKIKKHPRWGAELMQLVYFLEDIIPIVATHHENFDGSGYPLGISREEIPIEARILSVADVYEALTAERSYRPGYPREEALKIMEQEKCIKLDPEVTDVFISMVRRGRFREDANNGQG